ncbi:MAG: helix-turn-helix transcriptional regulator [Gemmatimonadales bacterium]
METSPTELHEAAGLPPGYGGPRGEILVELKRNAAQSARELADRLGLSLNAVRHHLKELESLGLIEYRREPRGVGAPVYLYLLSTAGERLFPRRYEELVTEVLARMADPSGRSALVSVLEERYEALSRRLQAELSEVPLSERIERVARILSDEGYMAEWARSGESLTLKEHNCAIQAVAERFPEVCEAEARFLRQVLAADVERRRHILTGCGSCEYSIHSPAADAPVPLTPRSHPGPAAGTDAEPSRAG